MIENGIARFDIAQKINKRDLIALRPRERSHNEVEISRGKPRPTIRPDHRDFIMRDGDADGKSDYWLPLCAIGTDIFTWSSRRAGKVARGLPSPGPLPQRTQDSGRL